MKDKIKELLEKEERNFDANELEDIEIIYSLLETESIIDYSVVIRSSSDGADFWLQGEYYNKNIGATIIFDHDINDNIKNIDELVADIEKANKRIAEINSKIK